MINLRRANVALLVVNVLLLWLLLMLQKDRNLRPQASSQSQTEASVDAHKTAAFSSVSAKTKNLEERIALPKRRPRWASPIAPRNGGSVITSDPELMLNPEFFAAYKIYLVRTIRDQYGPLYNALHLSNKDRVQLEECIREKILGHLDLTAAEQGKPTLSTADYLKIRGDIDEKIEREISQILSPDDYSKWTNYIQTLPGRTHFALVQARLNYSDEPLTEQQLSSMVRIYNTATAGERRQAFIPPDVGERFSEILTTNQFRIFTEINANKAELINARRGRNLTPTRN